MKIPLKLVTKSEVSAPQAWSLASVGWFALLLLVVTEQKGLLWEEVKWVLPASRGELEAIPAIPFEAGGPIELWQNQKAAFLIHCCPFHSFLGLFPFCSVILESSLCCNSYLRLRTPGPEFLALP